MAGKISDRKSAAISQAISTIAGGETNIYLRCAKPTSSLPGERHK
jgi:hypothetical protein